MHDRFYCRVMWQKAKHGLQTSFWSTVKLFCIKKISITSLVFVLFPQFLLWYLMSSRFERSLCTKSLLYFLMKTSEYTWKYTLLLLKSMYRNTQVIAYIKFDLSRLLSKCLKFFIPYRHLFFYFLCHCEFRY